MSDFALNADIKVTTLVIVRVIPLLPWKRQIELSSLDFGSTNFDNQFLTILCSGKETRVTWTLVRRR